MKFIRKHYKLFIIVFIALIVDLFAALFVSPILSGLLLSLQTLVLYTWLFFRASRQVLQPQDGLSGLRWIILTFIVVALVFSIPSIIYTAFRFMGIEYEWLRGITNVTGGLSKIAAPILLVLVFEYKQESK